MAYFYSKNNQITTEVLESVQRVHPCMECVNDKVAILQMNDSLFSSYMCNKGRSPNLLQHLKLQKESEVAQPCLTLCNPMNYSLLVSSVMGFSRQDYWSVLPKVVEASVKDPLFQKNLLHQSFDLNPYPASRFSHHYFSPGDCDSLKDCLATWLQDACTALCTQPKPSRNPAK